MDPDPQLRLWSMNVAKALWPISKPLISPEAPSISTSFPPTGPGIEAAREAAGGEVREGVVKANF